MLQLINVTKFYKVADEKVPALKGINLRFRKNEFVSILGASGCGKTTLLNIIGGLDQYSSGDLKINGVSTKGYTDKDWDTYRNHSVGFIFQSYHLIPHQTVLQNVELALMISGVSKWERRRRAIEALSKVGLADKLNVRPNQLSGGQAQRVAIARALINDPEILLADEPTGALDSKTSVQIMNLLKEISKDRLVIMVTHNPELAYQYSTRIINLLDGLVVGDTMPFHGVPEEYKQKSKKRKGRKKHSSMSRGMAMSLSLKNLLSKGKRTAMVTVAGSIGIIGVSMVLAMSAGVQNYIDSMQNDMLSGYPLTIQQSAMDYSALLEEAEGALPEVEVGKLEDKVYVDSLLETLGTLSTTVTQNTITEAYVHYLNQMPKEYLNVLQFGYEFELSNNIYTEFKVSKDSTIDSTDASGILSVTGIRSMYTSILSEQDEYKQWASMISTVSTFDEIPNNMDYILSQYDVIANYDTGNGNYTSGLTQEQLKEVFNSKESVIMVLNNNKTDDLLMGQFGYFTQEEFLNYAYSSVNNEFYDEELGLIGSDGLPYSFFLGEDAKTFTYYPNDSVYRQATFMEKTILETQLNGALATEGNRMEVDYVYQPYASGKTIAGMASEEFTNDGAVDLKVKIILRKKDHISYGCLSSGFYYTNALTQHVLQTEKDSEIVQFASEKEDKKLDALPYFYLYSSDVTGETVTKPSVSTIMASSGGGLMSMAMAMMSGGAIDMSVSVGMLGGSDIPVTAAIYPTDFDTKIFVTDYLDAWNLMCEEGQTYKYTQNGVEHSVKLTENDDITYSDTVGLIIFMVNTMIDIVTIVLISFTALSLIVSTVMIGIITYVSVVERVKEIGILRAVGARKKDIKRLFNSETFIIGLSSGVFGIAITYLAQVIINAIVRASSNGVIIAMCALPFSQALIMIGVSVLLTLISGLIPASSAAKKDPVVALRTE
ncbi:MAG: ABC transporter ATP-binding protein/permease [Clostridiales bacterium]|nr:ABC transporter ATP-binding protein/permease [Clostridiales bacterium]